VTPDAPAYPQPASQPDPAQGGQPAPAAPKRRWLIVVIAAWAVLLLVVANYSVRRDSPTVPEQRSIAQASPVVDRAIGELAVAAGPDAVVEVSGRRIENGCRITPMRSGATLSRDITLRTGAAGGRTLLDRIAQRLPGTYQAAVQHGKGGTADGLHADAGDFVAIKGGVSPPGVIQLTATTGCRPVVQPMEQPHPPHASPGIQASAQPQYPVGAEAARVLAALGASKVAARDSASAPCPGGGVVATAHAVGQPVPQGPLAPALRPLAGTHAVVVTDQPTLYAYRSGPLSVVVEAAGGEIRVAATTACSG
jgi:hypothetical protein